MKNYSWPLQKLAQSMKLFLRKLMINEDGTSRDSVLFSIINDEWPAIRQCYI